MINFSTKPKIPHITYGEIGKEFYKTLRTRVESYFTATGQNRFANRAMHIKTVVLLFLMFGAYTLILSNWFRGPEIILLQIFFHTASFIMWIGIAHDAHHDAYTPNKYFNKFLLFLGDTTGVSSYVMDYNHVKAHHTAVNIPHHDVSIDSFGLMRFHPEVPWRPHHQYQHIYIWLLYGISSIFKLFLFDFFTLNRKSIGAYQIEKHPWPQMLYMFVMKFFALFYSLVLPILLLDINPWFIVIGFVVGHLISGTILGLVFQVTHLCDYSMFTAPDEKERIKNSFAIHVMENTSTFSPNSLFMCWFTGGLNHHTIHHIFPDICQSHFPYLTPILRRSAKEFGIPFKEYPSFYAAIKSHYNMLYKLGQNKSYKSETFRDYPLAERYSNNFQYTHHI